MSAVRSGVENTRRGLADKVYGGLIVKIGSGGY